MKTAMLRIEYHYSYRFGIFAKIRAFISKYRGFDVYGPIKLGERHRVILQRMEPREVDDDWYEQE